MSGDEFKLVKVETLDDLQFAEGQDDIEILMIHTRSGSRSFALHGFLKQGGIGYLDEKQPFLDISDCALVYTKSGEVEGRFGALKKIPHVDLSTPDSTYEFMKIHNESRKTRCYRFPSNGAWEAYKIVEPMPEQPSEPVVEESV